MSKINTIPRTTVKDVPADKFISSFAEYLRSSNKFEVPDWAVYVKTASHKQLAPFDTNWLYMRAASLARKIYFKQRIGVRKFCQIYGGKMRRGSAPEHHHKAAGKLIRHCLQQLEKMGIIEMLKEQIEGDDGTTSQRTVARGVSKKGRKDMDNIARKIVTGR